MATRFASNGGVRIGYEVDEGDGPPLVLVHGLGYARWGWEPLRPLLAGSLRLVLFDNRGIGESDVPEGPYAAEEMATDVVAVMDDAGMERAHLLGTSLGGMVAQEVALAAPERIDRLVLVASTPGGDVAYPIPEPTLKLIAEMPTLAPEEALRKAIANALSPASRERDPDLVERILAHRLAAPQDPAGWQAQAAAGTTYSGGDRLRGITAPTLVVHGTSDAVVDPRNADLLAGLIPDTSVVMLDGAGHLPFWEEPQRVAEVVTAFLAPTSAEMYPGWSGRSASQKS
ncbi:MAG: alpha/beta fold hydrolase [Nitriliruptorales bacterium]